ncbi:MAG: LytTR family DNA-binding domain-containing protein [Pseudomonadota bacterium]
MKGLSSLRIAIEILKWCAIVAALGLIFAWLGVYGTARVPFLQRWVFWTTTMVVGAGGYSIVEPIIWGRRFEPIAPIFKIAATAALISIPVTLTLVFLLNRSPPELNYLTMQFGYVLVISLIITSASYLLKAARQNKVETEGDANPVGAFMERLPVKFRTAELYAISSEDHYLRVHTSLGEELILMRLADAVRELNGADGLQVHRSWWVAKDGVTDEKRIDGRSLLVLPSGTEVPVSRSYRTKARDAGLIR